jgi:predicted Zn-dependent protease
VYTGLIKFLDNGDAFAGVMGHEIAHADLRHTSRNLQRQYGVSLLLQIISGQSESQLVDIAGQIAGTAAGLSFSREFETESDEKSVEYLAPTGFACDGAKLFFQKLEAQGQGSSQPQFLSTHPSPENRIQNIEEKAAEENCSTEPSSLTPYQQFQNNLP